QAHLDSLAETALESKNFDPPLNESQQYGSSVGYNRVYNFEITTGEYCRIDSNLQCPVFGFIYDNSVTFLDRIGYGWIEYPFFALLLAIPLYLLRILLFKRARKKR